MKSIFTAALFSLLFTCAYAQDACVAKGKELFLQKEYPEAENVLKSCLIKNAKNPDALISLAGVQMVLGKFAEAENNFKLSMHYMPHNSPYIAYVNSLLGDIAIRKPNLQEAAFFYDAALRAEPANINALVGKGITEEKAGRVNEAVEYYRRALAVDFTNIVARERLIGLEPDILTYEEVLITMKERNIIAPDSNSFTVEDEALLSKMISAERDNAIEYIAVRHGGKLPAGMIVERDGGKVYVRKMLTLTGYEELIHQLSIDAKNFFLNKKNILPGDIFKLRDFDGKPVFDEKGHITDQGLAVYTKSLAGYKAYVLPGELLPSTQTEIDALAKQYIRQGYSEITMSEFIYLMRHTRCSEQTLIKDVQVRVINIGNDKKRIFVVSDPRRQDVPAVLPWQYILDLRMNYNEAKSNNAPVYSNAFGMGGGADLKLCAKDGSLAGGSLQDLAKEASARAAARRNK